MDRSRLPIHIEQPRVKAAFDIRSQSEPFPPPVRVRAPDGAPNVLVILLDDMGFGASTAFGGPCSMPAAEQLAGHGLKFNRFHTTAICSPTRAALLTGRNHHSVGMGILTDYATAAPGYTGMRPADAATIAQTLYGNGYATGAFGKWHQTPQFAITPVGPFDHWPTSEGFEKFYGFVGGISDQFYPSLYEGTTQIEPPASPDDGYHLSEDLVNQARRWIGGVRSVDRHKPWFTYLAFGATHSPFQVPDSWHPVIARQADCQTCFMCEAYCPVDALFVAPTSGPAPPGTIFTDEARLAADGRFGEYRRWIGWGSGRRPGSLADRNAELTELAAPYLGGNLLA